MVEAWAYQLLSIGEWPSIGLSWLILFASAAIGVIAVKPRFELGRSVYVALLGLAMFLCALSSLFALGIIQAVKHDLLAVIALLLYGSLIPTGVLAGICAAARSTDAFGTRRRWFLAFIPFGNLALLFVPSRERRNANVLRIARNLALIFAGVLLLGGGKALADFVEGQVERQTELAANDPEVQKKVIRYVVDTNGLGPILREAAINVRIPERIDSTVTLSAVDVENDTLRYTYRVSDGNTPYSKGWHDLVTNAWCMGPGLKPLMDLGATVEGNFLSTDNVKVGQLRVNLDLCRQWMSEFEHNMQDAAHSIKQPVKVDEITTLASMEYNDRTLSYYYQLSETPTGAAWKYSMEQKWCQLDQFKQLIKFGINLRGVYTTWNNAPIGEIMINSTTCDSINSKTSG